MKMVPCSRRKSRAGVTLIIVLAFLVLLSGLLVAFFVNATTDRAVAAQFARETDVKMLADSAVNLVEGQIRDATRGQDPDAGGSTLAWASQPGMISTFSATGAPLKKYKLYSADELTVDTASFTPSTSDLAQLPPDWNKNDALYTDLNEPVAKLILDANGTPQSKYFYPVVDPSALDSSGQVSTIDGFSITNPPGYGGGTSAPGNNFAPMPVKWLYLLQDGTLSAGTPPTSTGTSANGTYSATVSGASATNKIVGRVAFWTDDETAKVNINTASEGSYWDTPRVYSQDDYGQLAGSGSSIYASLPGLAACQPAQHEYSRYPGHPATTCLSPIFGKTILPITYSITAVSAQQFDPYFAMSPRINEGTTLPSGSSVKDSADGTRLATGVLPARSDRLYASIDELMFTPELNGSGSRIPNTAQNSSSLPNLITRDVLERSKFFLTANSTAPEVTLNNTPRVAIWPIGLTDTQRTPYDKLLAFCSTINNKAYYFTRSNARSMTDDFTANNASLYTYLQNLTGRNVPGIDAGGGSGSFLGKYGLDRDQILTSIYDYIRCTNLSDTSSNGIGSVTPYTPPFSATSIDSDANKAGAGEVLPIRINNTQGYGRFYTISEADLLFYGTKHTSGGATTAMQAMFLMQFSSPMQGTEGIKPNLRYEVSGLENLQVQFQNSDGTPLGWTPAGFISTNNYINNGINYLANADWTSQQGRSLGGTEGIGMGFITPGGFDSPLKQLNYAASTGLNTTTYPFYTPTDITVPFMADGKSLASKFAVRSAPGSEIQIKIDNVGTLNTVVQTVHLKFPDPTAPSGTSGYLNVPWVVPGLESGDKNGTPTPAQNSFNMRGLKGNTMFFLVRPQDTVVGLDIAGVADPNGISSAIDHTAGDVRMVAALTDVPAAMFHAHADYTNALGNQNANEGSFAYGLSCSCGTFYNPALPPVNDNSAYYRATTGTLVNTPKGFPSLGTSSIHHPVLPKRVGQYVTRVDGVSPGDWDTGWGDEKDGGYINKPDEGDRVVPYADGSPRMPYTTGNGTQVGVPAPTLYSPNRVMPSPLMFGSIPTGVKRNQPWQTLLFNPRPEDPTHPGKTAPADYLLADLFWMPVVEPYAISQPFSTAGKINMNYQIQPFTYIRRDTGVEAVLKATEFLAISPDDSAAYKPYSNSLYTTSLLTSRRHRIDLSKTKTLAAFDAKFANYDVFRSATEICSINLIPLDVASVSSAADMASFWQTNSLTGNNARNKPYVDIYPRLTTKSNTYTVHVRVQSVAKSASVPADQWVVGKDQITGEYRGSSIVERYIDVNDQNLPDFTTLDPSNPKAGIDQYYKLRVISSRRFSP